MDLERGRAPSHVLDRGIGAAGLGVEQVLVALAERAANRVLPRQSNRDTVGQQAGQGQRLGLAPVNGWRLGIDARPAAIEQGGQPGMRG